MYVLSLFALPLTLFYAFGIDMLSCNSYAAPHCPVLLGVPVLPGVDRCPFPGDGGLPLL